MVARTLKQSIAFSFLFFIVIPLCYAIEPGSISYKPMNSGVEIVFNADGSDWQQIKAVGEADLKIGDRTDVRQARKKAILRAKADISKFLTERITTEETSEEITKLSLTATSQNGASLGEEGTRKIVDTTIEKIVNQSEAILKGILELESEENVSQKYVRVVVGVSRKTMQIANSVGNALQDKSVNQSAGQMAVPDNQESVIRKSRNTENF